MWLAVAGWVSGAMLTGAEATTWVDGRAPGAAALWEFERDDCVAGLFPNSGSFSSSSSASSSNAFGALRRNATASTSCLAGRGLQANAGLAANNGVLVESYRDAHALSEAVALSNGGFTVEVWAGFSKSTSTASEGLAPIFTIGQGNGGESTYCDSVDLAAMSMNLQLYQTGHFLKLVSVYEYNVGTVACQIYPVVGVVSSRAQLAAFSMYLHTCIIKETRTYIWFVRVGLRFFPLRLLAASLFVAFPRPTTERRGHRRVSKSRRFRRHPRGAYTEPHNLGALRRRCRAV